MALATLVVAEETFRLVGVVSEVAETAQSLVFVVAAQILVPVVSAEAAEVVVPADIASVLSTSLTLLEVRSQSRCILFAMVPHKAIVRL